MSDLVIASHRGPYTAAFTQDPIEAQFAQPVANAHYVIDQTVARLYARELSCVLNSASVLLISASEQAKTLSEFTRYIEFLVARRVRRGDVLIAVGGGVIQDIVCFLAATLLRGLEWRFVPTTLLAQTDSCIGSKSSINVGSAKNILGTYTPPRQIMINGRFLDTLPVADLRSGIGEMLKVHAIDASESFDRIALEYPRLLSDRAVLLRFVRASLEIKRRIIEIDEFDAGPRNVMNYGHSFGHAIESATSYAIPHGIAVTMGMDMANFISWKLGIGAQAHYLRMHPVLEENYRGYERVPIPLTPFLEALGKDKKNTKDRLGLILPGPDGRIAKTLCANDEAFRLFCAEFLSEKIGAASV